MKYYTIRYTNRLGKELNVIGNFKNINQAQRFAEKLQGYSHGGVIMEYKNGINTKSWYRQNNGEWA